MINDIYDYLESGFKIFGLHGKANGICGCGDVDCTAFYKHPIMSNWQNVPNWSDDQIECFDALGHFNTGFGVLCKGWLIIDVDARNGGVLSFKQLCKDVPSILTCGYVVNTGSGGGSQHWYFKLPEDAKTKSLLQSLKSYVGIDFKTSGFVVGCGSMHDSGNLYEIEKGYPQDIVDAPSELIALLERPTFYRVSNNGLDVDIDEAHIVALLEFIDPSPLVYDEWITIGMAIHHCLDGGGYDVWDNWSVKSSKYDNRMMPKKWHSFGKSANPAGYGTLLHYAKQGGYCEPITFVYDGSLGFVDDEVANGGNDATTNKISNNQSPLDDFVDVKRPPDFLGELTQWINDQCLYPRENLAVACALTAVSSLAGMRYIDEMDGMSANIMSFGVAGSGTGKESIMQAYLQIMKAATVQAAVHGAFKSEQEIMRNLIRHQAAFYCVDELGIVLSKLVNSSKKGGSSYLEGIIGLIMSVYSKANGYLPISGDLKDDIKQKLLMEYAQIEKKLEKLAEDSSQDRLREQLTDSQMVLLKAIENIDLGLENPYFTLLGFTTPVTFNELMTFDQATNGFMARSLIFNDLETNPKRKAKFVKKPMPQYLANILFNMYSFGRFDQNTHGHRVEFTGEKVTLPTTDDAKILLDEVYERFYQLAETHKASTGLEAVARRGYELTSKISLICAMPSGLRTVDHVKYAYALAKRDVDQKIKLAYSTDNKKSADGLAAKVLSILDNEHGETLGVICNRLRGTPKAQVEALLDDMVAKGMLNVIEKIKSSNKKPYKVFYVQ